ncbi:cation:dicarboxylate symporter family transporter [Streptomyces sp. NPDC087425]|uniref:cation:dicarboxylate symporter family transporter n=1 Tax=Streptomyces sp. NPDC087425 TaxID=3365787 RepID=UPI0037FEE9A1
MPQSVPSLPRRVARILRTSLFAQVACALVLGIVVGKLWPGVATDLQPLGDGFTRLIKTIISPLVFCVVVVGIAKAGDLKAFGRIGLKALIWFEIASTLALVIGLVAANVFQPGGGMHVDPATLNAAAVDAKTAGGSLPSTTEFVLNALPTSFIGAFAENSLLQVLILACLVGAALLHLGHTKVPQVLPAIEQAQEIIFSIVGFVMRLAPIAVFGAMAVLIGQYGLGVIETYAKLIILCYAAAALFVVLLGVVLKALTGISLWKFVRYIREEMLLALGTASTEAVMPRVMQKLRRAGARDDAVGLVLPTGYSFNLDGASLYLSIGTLFIAQAVGVDLSLGQQITVVLVLMLTSKGMAGIPGSAFLALSATASSLGAIPAGAVALLLGVDRIMDSMRVVTNLLGNCVAVFAVSRWEGALDLERAKKVLNGEQAPDADPAPDADTATDAESGDDQGGPTAPDADPVTAAAEPAATPAAAAVPPQKIKETAADSS